VKEADTHQRVIRILENHLGRSGKDISANECVNFIDLISINFLQAESQYSHLITFKTEENVLAKDTITFKIRNNCKT
jgi:hypothetical protein